MNIKSLLLGSAAALVAVSGAKAADAVVIPEPEAVEYVRVCDAAGAGYFYIPGGETCLKISGYVQYQISSGSEGIQDEGWNKATEGRLQFDSWTDSEYGAVQTQIRLTTTNQAFVRDITLNDEGDVVPQNDEAFLFGVDRAHLSIGGLNMGLNGSLYDFSQTGAVDDLVGNGYTGNQMMYTADFGAGSFAIQLVDDSDYDYMPDVIAKLTYAAGDLGLAAGVVYSDADEDFGAKLTATYAGFGAVVQYSGDDLTNSYAGPNDWTIGANYGFDATDKLNLNIGAAYAFGDDTDQFAVGVEATYALTETFTVSSRVRYYSAEDDIYDMGTEDDRWTARMRFKASF